MVWMCDEYPVSECTDHSDVPLLSSAAEHEDHVPGGSTPQQYALPDGATELQDLIEHRDMNFALGNVFKACYRMGACSHSDDLREANKILWFAQRELKRLEKLSHDTTVPWEDDREG